MLLKIYSPGGAKNPLKESWETYATRISHSGEKSTPSGEMRSGTYFNAYICLMHLWNDKYKLIIHITYWFLVLVFLSLFFGHFTRDSFNALFYVCLQLPLVILTTYTINYWLVPRFLFRKSYYKFFYFLIATIMVSLWLNTLISVFTFIKIWEFDLSEMPGTTFDIFYVSAGLYLAVLVGIAIHFVRDTFKNQEQNYRLQQKEISTELKLKETRLKMLQNQLHPHMLFNSLNLIYGYSLKKSEKTSGLVINLSNMLDYMLYRCNDDLVLLENEINFLKDYIELEKQKFDKELDLNVYWPDDQDKYMIAPLLLLPVCENCFKHVKHQAGRSPKISISGRIRDERLYFSATNSFIKGSRKSKVKGIGIQNLKERLNILYENRHELKILEKDETYSVDLTIHLDKIYFD
jgi:sensor histidine kinase YesM